MRTSQKYHPLDGFYISSGIERLANLVVFRMKYDCTDRILTTVADNNIGSLRVVDVRNSQYVTDAGEGFKKGIYFTMRHTCTIEHMKRNKDTLKNMLRCPVNL